MQNVVRKAEEKHGACDASYDPGSAILTVVDDVVVQYVELDLRVTWSPNAERHQNILRHCVYTYMSIYLRSDNGGNSQFGITCLYVLQTTFNQLIRHSNTLLA